MIKITKSIIQDNDTDKILNEYEKRKVFTMDFRKDLNKIYLTKDFLQIDLEEFSKLIYDLNIINKVILKKAVFHILKNDNVSLEKLGFSQKMISLVQYIFKKLDIEDYTKLPLTYFGRYDILVDNENNFKIVEINSETPAGLPESINSDIMFEYLDQKQKDIYQNPNRDMDYNLYLSLQGKIAEIISSGKKNFIVIFANDNDDMKNPRGEDYGNSLYMTEFFKRQLYDYGITVKLGNAEDLEFRENGIYYNNIKQDFIRTFYPMEWIFTDKGAEDFLKFYISGDIEIVNNPLNLITQSKAIWAYIFENAEKINLNKEEKDILNKYVPKYHFKEPESEYISKPLFYREGIGIGEKFFIGKKVYQEKIDQKKFEVETFDGQKQGYITMGMYFGESGYIGTYNRFGETFITTWDSYYISLIVKGVKGQ